jgi:hypothetical protein
MPDPPKDGLDGAPTFVVLSFVSASAHFLRLGGNARLLFSVSANARPVVLAS